MCAQNILKWTTKPPLVIWLSAILMVAGSSLSAWADDAAPDDVIPAYATLDKINVKKGYALNIGRYNLDTHTEIIGWRINDDWYFGRQDGLDSGLTLVWQQAESQVSLSKEGVRLTRRF